MSPAAIRARMNAFIRSATGAFEVSSVDSQTGQTSSDSSSASGRALLARGRWGGEASATSATGGEPSRRSERALDPGVELGGVLDRPAIRRRTLPAASMK